MKFKMTWDDSDQYVKIEDIMTRKVGVAYDTSGKNLGTSPKVSKGMILTWIIESKFSAITINIKTSDVGNEYTDLILGYDVSDDDCMMVKEEGEIVKC